MQAINTDVHNLKIAGNLFAIFATNLTASIALWNYI